jgi:hypothetical protein
VVHPHLKLKKFIFATKKKEGFKILESNEQRRAFTFVKEEEGKVASTGTKGERLERVEKKCWPLSWSRCQAKVYLSLKKLFLIPPIMN